jgi:MFS family permease
MIGVFLSPLNVNFTSVALPTLRDHFSVSVEQVAWVGTAYFIPTVVLMPLQASLGQRWGLRRMYAVGLSLLSIGGIMTALARSFVWLIVSRVIQGIGWSALYPLALVLIQTHFPPEKQGEMMGTWESAVGVAAIIGPVLGGVLVDFFGWPAIYYTIAMIAGTGALLTIISVPPRPAASEFATFDWPGAIGLTTSILLLLLGIAHKSPPVLVASLVAFGLWVWIARRTSAPFVDPGIFQKRQFVSASGAATLRMVIGVAALMSLPLFLEDVQTLNPITVGILLPIYSLFLFLGARPGGRWADRSGGRKPGVTGFILMTIGVVLLIFLDVRVSVLLIGVALALRGIGAGVSQAPFAKVATNASEPQQAAMVAGLYGMIRYSGLALGSALVGILLQARFAHYGSDGRGAAAIPAFRELYAVLALIGLVGLGLSWLMGTGQTLKSTERLPEVANG